MFDIPAIVPRNVQQGEQKGGVLKDPAGQGHGSARINANVVCNAEVLQGTLNAKVLCNISFFKLFGHRYFEVDARIRSGNKQHG